MVNRTRLWQIGPLLVLALLLTACGGGTTVEAPTSTPNTIATRVAEEQAVAATLTAAAPAAPPVVEATVTLRPTDAAKPDAPTATNTAIEIDVPPVASDTPIPPSPTSTDTPLPPPPAATDTPLPPPPTATNTPLPPSPTPFTIAVLPVDGGGGDIPNIRNNNPVKGGRNVTLPGFSPAEVSEPMVFRDRMVFQAEVFDANVGTYDGAGIENVSFTIFDSNSSQVHQRTENHAGYCVFGGGEPDCNVWVFTEHNNTWPGGAPMSAGFHDVIIDINPQNGENIEWFWSFTLELP